MLTFTDCHPYYTQQLAFHVWNVVAARLTSDDPVQTAISDVVQLHDYDYERLWNTLNKTDKNTLSRLATKRVSSHQQPPSTIQSSLKRLCKDGLVIKNGHYKVDDPFFSLWIAKFID